ncbi:MAG: alpha/beta fold hydrolase [Actinomycetota bacterium]
MPFATAPDGARLFYDVAGSGPPVVLVHGGLWDRRLWDDQWEAFTTRFRTIRPDFRGFGRSDPAEREFNLTEDLLTVLDAEGVLRAAVVGLSLGGYAAIDLALTHPDRISTLVLVGAGVTGFDDWGEDIRRHRKETEAAVQRGDLGAALELDLELWCPLRTGSDDRQRLIARENLNAPLAEDLADVFEQRAIDRLGEISVPTLVLVGDRDIPEMLRLADLLATGIPGARKAVIEEADHVPNVRKPEVFNGLVIGFLEEVAA